MPSIIFPIPLHSCHTTLHKKSHNIVRVDDYQSFISKIYHQNVFYSSEIPTSLEIFVDYFQGSQTNKNRQQRNPYFLVGSISPLSVIKKCIQIRQIYSCLSVCLSMIATFQSPCQHLFTSYFI